jgi:biopolymer transport protein ExbB/TolQ
MLAADDAEVVRHTMARVAALVDRELRHGLAGLATVAATAPFLGMFGTLVGMYSSFGELSGEKTSVMAYLFGNLSDAIVPTACGLLVAVPALAGYQYLRKRVDAFDVDMENASLELVNWMGSQRRRGGG